MIVNCDKCGAKFQLADDKITDKGTKVRCSKCKAIFTVKKSEAPAAPAAPAASPPSAPPGPAPAPPATGVGKKGDDPFSDFNFYDDLDFGEQEINVKGKGEDQGFLDSVPSAPVPSRPAAPVPSAPAEPADDGGFDFSDEEFSLSEPAPAPVKAPAPAPKAPPPPPKAPPPPPKPVSSPASKKSGEADEFGDFKFDDESFSESAAPAAPAASGGGSEEWGNVSIGSDDPAPKSKPKAGAEELDDTGFGDFKFDEGGEEKDDEIDVDSFRRSETSRAPVRDDLEASIGDGDSEPEARPTRKLETVEPPPPPPKPVIKMEKRQGEGMSKGLVALIVLAVLFLGGIFGGVGYTNSKGWFTFGDLFTFKLKKLGDIPAVDRWLIENGHRKVPDTGAVEIVDGSVKPQQVAREDLGLTIIVITGQVANRTNKVRSAIKVGAGLKNANGDVVATASSYCGVSFSESELKNMSPQAIQDVTDTSAGRDMKCMEVQPGTVLPFTIVFFDYPSDGGALKVSAPQVLESKVLGE